MAAPDPLSGFAANLFAHRRFVVTGAGAGIGQAIALGFARYGATVVLIDRDAAAVQTTADQIATLGARSEVHLCDLGCADEVAELANNLGQSSYVDGLVNNAGIFIRSGPDSDSWRQVMAVNLDAVNALSLACASLMRDGGSIVNIASTSALRASAGTSAYAASKAGVVGLTQAMAVDLAPRSIRVNAVAPGEVATHMGTHSPEILGPMLQRIPLSRQATPSEIAAVVLFLSSAMASYVTGATWLVDGGFMVA